MAILSARTHLGKTKTKSSTPSNLIVKFFTLLLITVIGKTLPFSNYIGPSGEPVQVSGICTIPIDILNEKIYLIIWFWYFLLNIMSPEIDSN